MLSTGFPQPQSEYVFTSATWPRFIVAGIVIAAICQLLFGDGPENQLTEVEAEDERPPLRRLGAAILLTALYIQCISWAGFYITTPLFIAGYLLIFGEHRPLRILIFALATSVIFNLVFTTFLFISLPTGSLDLTHQVNMTIREAFVRGGGM